MIALVLAPFLFQTTPQWTLRTGDTEAIVRVESDRPVIEGLCNVRERRAWLPKSEISLFDHASVNGRERPIHWHFESASKDQGAGTVTLRFQSADPKLELRSVWRARPGAGPIEHRIEVVNREHQTVTIPEQDSLNLNGIDPGGDSQIWWERRGASNALTEGGVFQERVAAGTHLDLVSNHHDPKSPVPWMTVQVGDRRGLYVGWEFSGLGHVEARAGGPHSVSIRAGLMPDFRTDIHAGETLKLPGALVGCTDGDMDEEARSLTQFITDKLRPNPPKSFADPVTVVNEYIDGGGDKAKTADVLRCLEFAHSIGTDAFMCDAMWFPGVGDWRWDPARFPYGGMPISNAVHADGMRFGLWSSWSNGGVSTDPGALSVRGPYGHPDWFEHNVPPTWQPGPFYGISACMGDEDAKNWAIAKTQQIVGNSRVDLLKTDVHPMINECVQTDHRHGYGSDVGYWSCTGVYEVWDRLRKRFPSLVLENCSGASHIKDFGVVQHCAYTVTTDTLSNLPDRAGIYDSTYILPPCALMTYTYENGYGLPGDEADTYLFRSAMATAWQLAPTDSSKWSANSKAAVTESLKTYKNWLRPILRDCEPHHVLPRPDGKNWDGMFYWSPKLQKGTFFVFRPDSDLESKTVRLAGLKPAETYRLWSEDGWFEPFSASGNRLMSDGLKLRLPTKYSSDLVHIQNAKNPLPAGWGKLGEPGPVSVDQSPDPIEPHVFISWLPVAGARSFQLCVSPNPDLSSPTTNTVVYAPSLNLPHLVGGKTYYYRVTAVALGGVRRSGIGKFQVQGPLAWDGKFISDLPFLSAEAGSDRVHRDENFKGSPLSIGGVLQRKGLWTHSFNDGRPADIVLDIAGQGFARFIADVGLDDSSGGGSVQFEVLADGVKLKSTPVLHPREMLHLDCDVAGVKHLTLRVLNGGDGYTSDHAVWGMARLLRTGATDPFKR